MEGQVKTRLCWNCEGRVAGEKDNCPFCGVYVGSQPVEQEQPTTPPYQSENEQFESSEQLPDVAVAEAEVEDEDVNDWKKPFAALVFLFSGTTLFLFSIALALFSSDGVLTLQWNNSWWPLISIFSIGFLIAGWHFVDSVED